MNIDAYTAACSPYTRPVVQYLVELIRKTTPGLEEQIKWGAPSFELKGRIICQIMAHQKHVNFIFTQGKDWEDPYGLLVDIGEKSRMKGFKQVARRDDLPEEKKLQHYIRAAVAHAGGKPALSGKA